MFMRNLATFTLQPSRSLSLKMAATLIALLLGATGIGTMSSASARAIVGENTFTIAAGDVDQTSVVLWAHAHLVGEVRFTVTVEAGGDALTATVRATDPTLPVKAMVDGLAPGTRYSYLVTAPDGTEKRGTFRTAAASGTRAGLRFGATGDWMQSLAPFPAIKNVAARDLAFMVLLGDTIYADIPSPAVRKRQATTLAEFRAKHNENHQTRLGLNTWADARASTTIFATIDDHEVTNDFSGGDLATNDERFGQPSGSMLRINETPLFEDGLQAFTEYMPIRDERYAEGDDPAVAGKPKLYRTRTFGDDAAIFVLDARSFRDATLPTLPFDQVNDPDKVAAYLAQTFTPGRSMLGVPQFNHLKADLLTAQQRGVTWKFIMLPEPIQNFGVLNAQDRYEGYAAERAALIEFLLTNNVTNVVFVTADFHGTIVNNLLYQPDATTPRTPTAMWEVITGAVAFDAPFGPLLVELAKNVNLITPQQYAAYTLLPRDRRDEVVRQVLDVQLRNFGYDQVGLGDVPIAATVLVGGYVAVHTYGWTEFEIDAATQVLTVTTYGVPWYSAQVLEKSPDVIAAYTPAIVSQFTVKPQEKPN